MRILLLTVDFPPAVGGIQNLLAKLAGGLAASHVVSVVAPRHTGAAAWEADLPYGVTRAPAFTFWPFVMLTFLCTALWSAIRRPPQVVICGHVLLGPVSWLVARLFGARLVVIAYALEIRAPRMQRLAGWTLRNAAAVVTISDFSRRAIMAHGVAPERIFVIHPGAATHPVTPNPVTPNPVVSNPVAPNPVTPNPVVSNPVAPSPEPPPSRPHLRAARFGGQAALRWASRAPNPDRIILTVARLAELYKGHDMVIRAMPLILAREPDTRYVIVGDGPRKPYLERLARSLGVESTVQFLGELPSEMLDAWYARADVFALLSRDSPLDGGAEGYGLTFIEAGAWGKPVVGGRSGGVPDAVIDGTTGLLVEPTDVGAIADAVIRLFGDSDLARRLGEHGRRRAVVELSWTNFVRAFETAIDSAGTSADVRAVRAPGSSPP